MPIRTLIAAAARPAQRNAPMKFPVRLEISNDTTAPAAPIANWPSDSWPPRPVITPTDKPTMMKPIVPVSFTLLALVISDGSTMNAASTRSPSIGPSRRTLRTERTAAGNGRAACTATHEPFSSPRPTRCFWASIATMMITNSTNWTRPASA